MNWVSRETNGSYHDFPTPSPSRDWHGSPFPPHGKLAQGLSLTMRPTKTATPNENSHRSHQKIMAIQRYIILISFLICISYSLSAQVLSLSEKFLSAGCKNRQFRAILTAFVFIIHYPSFRRLKCYISRIKNRPHLPTARIIICFNLLSLPQKYKTRSSRELSLEMERNTEKDKVWWESAAKETTWERTDAGPH